MLLWLVDLFITGACVYFIANILPGVDIKNYTTGLWVALLIGIFDATLGWLLRLITWPINFITFGLIYFLINVAMIMLVDKYVDGFNIKSFGWAILFAVLLAILGSIINRII